MLAKGRVNECLIFWKEMKEEWADCNICIFYRDYDKSECLIFQLFELPEKYIVNTDRKCCSLFSTEKKEVRRPDISGMDKGVLYFYNSSKPIDLIEDIDL